MAFCVPIASIDTITPLIAKMSKSSGIAVIWLVHSALPDEKTGFTGIGRHKMQRAVAIGTIFRAA